MYIGSTGSRGLHHLIYEVVDNAVDEALAGRNDYVEVTLHPDNSVTVRDAGAGIPVEVIPEQGLSALTVVLTKLHAGGKFGGDGYKVSGGLHGVGVSVVNALSEWLIADVHRDGKAYRQEFCRGEPTTELTGGWHGDRHRHDDQLPPRRRDLRGDRVVARHARAAPARDRVPDEGPAHRPDRRARGARRATSSTPRAASATSSPTSTAPRTPSTSTSSTSRASRTTAPSRSRCSGTRPTSSRSSRSRTTSTRTRAART